ncbi:hypothetical protein ACFX2A_018172 [Malus domestica]
MVSMQTIQKWSPLDTGFLKCNFDGAWDERLRKGGVGVIISNCSGEFLQFAQEIVSCSSGIFFERDSNLTLAAMNGEGDDHSILGPIVNDNRVLL